MLGMIVWWVDEIGIKQKQGHMPAFENHNKGMFEWANEVPDDDSKF